MPPKALQMPTLLKGDRIKVHFTLLETKEKRVWEGEVQQVHPCLCTFPSEMPGHLDGIPIPSPAANIKTTKVIVIKPNKAQKDTYPRSRFLSRQQSFLTSKYLCGFPFLGSTPSSQSTMRRLLKMGSRSGCRRKARQKRSR